MNHIKALIGVLQGVIVAGGVARIAYCCFAQQADSDEEKSYKIRIRNVIIFVVLSELIAGILRWAVSYFA